MLFSKKNPIKKQTNIRRKEQDSFLASHVSITSIITSKNEHRVSPKLYSERASLCTPKNEFQLITRSSRKKLVASMTIEAAVAVPFFFFALLALLYLIEIMSIQMNVRMGMHYAAEVLAEDLDSTIYVSTNTVEQAILEGIGAEKLDSSIVIDGSNGIDSSKSYVSIQDGIIELIVTYSVQLPIPKFGDFGLSFEEQLRAKGWTGYSQGIQSENEEIVYITDTASVYHTDYNCTHLQLSISSTSSDAIAELRNVYGGTYSACSICMENTNSTLNNNTVYISETGTHYHSTLNCSGLTRTIYAVPLSEVIGKGACSRCSQ